MRLRGERGSFLLQAVVMIMLLGLMGSVAVQMIMGRAMMLEKNMATEEQRFLAQAAESRLNDCLQGVSTQPQCNACAASANASPIMRGKTMRVRANPSWNNANRSCTMRIEVCVSGDPGC